MAAEQSTSSSRATAGGSVKVFLGNALLLPTGLVTAAVLTRALGPEGYGLFTLAATLIGWIAWSASSVLERPSIVVVAAAGDWRSVAAVVIRTHAVTGAVAAAVVLIGARPIGVVLGAPDIVPYLRLFSVELIVFSVSQAYAAVLAARGEFGQCAVGSAVRWLARMVLMVSLVALGLSVAGAVLGSIGGFLVELLVYRRFVRIRVRRAPTRFKARELLSYGAPAMVLALCLRFFGRVDLLALKGLGGSVADAGIYGAAQNLSVPPSLVTLSFAPLVLGTLSRLWYGGQRNQAQVLALDSIRFSIGLTAFAAAGAGAATEVVVLLFGSEFGGAGPVLARLLFAQVCLGIIAIASGVLVVNDQRRWLAHFGIAIIAMAIIGHVMAIPRFGALGAATVTLVASVLGALAMCGAACFAWGLRAPLGTIARTGAVAVSAYAFAAGWATPGLAVVAKLTVACVAIPVLFLLLGEAGPRERSLLLAWRDDVMR